MKPLPNRIRRLPFIYVDLEGTFYPEHERENLLYQEIHRTHDFCGDILQTTVIIRILAQQLKLFNI